MPRRIHALASAGENKLVQSQRRQEQCEHGSGWQADSQVSDTTYLNFPILLERLPSQV
jgi:hypothetical protein